MALSLRNRVLFAPFLTLSLCISGAQQAPAPSILENRASSPPQPGQPADFMTWTRAARTLQRTSVAGDDARSKAARLIEEAAGHQRTGRSGEFRRAMAHAMTLLRGETWDSKTGFRWSLVLRTDRAVADPARSILAQLTQAYPAPPVALRLKTGRGELLDVPARDLIDQPFVFDATPAGAPDGEHVVAVDVLDAGSVLARIEQTIQVVTGIESQRALVEQRLARIPGHDSAKATVRFPFDLARIVNLGIRRLGTNDFGLTEAGTMTYDFANGLRRSLAVLKSLEAGKDPLVRAKGDHERHYWFAEAGEIMPYRVYAPKTWNGKTRLPMMLVLHGNTRDHNFYFDRDGGILPILAEKHGFVVACPMGYRPNAGYNANSFRGRAIDPARARQGDLSEKDAMNVLERVASEYDVDRSRIFLFGHSAGGAGTWFLGSKYPGKFAGMAISAASTRPDGFPFENLKPMPLLVFIGSKDSPPAIAATRSMVQALKERGIAHRYEELEGATHDNIVARVEPKIFEYFRKFSTKP